MLAIDGSTLEGVSVALISSFGAVTVAILGYLSHRSRKSERRVQEIHDSVNHRHAKSDGRGVMDLLVESRRDMGEIKGRVESVSNRLDRHSAKITNLLERPPCKHPDALREFTDAVQHARDMTDRIRRDMADVGKGRAKQEEEDAG